MFRRIKIELSGPICTCDEQDLVWSVPRDAKGYAALQIECKTCGTYLYVPNDKFRAQFVLDTPYPSKKQEKKESPAPTKLTVLDGGNVVPFAPNGETKDSDGSSDGAS